MRRGVTLSLLARKLSEGRGGSAEVWVFEKMLPGCCVWECELLLIAEKLYQELLPGASPTPKHRQSPWKPVPFSGSGIAAVV